MSTKKDFGKLIKAAEQQGWKVVPTNNGHLRWLAPDGKNSVISGSTESDIRGIKNHIARLRKYGFKG